METTEHLTHAYIVSSMSEEAAAAAAREKAAALLCEGGTGSPCHACRHCRKVFAGIHPDVIAVLREKDDKGVLRRELRVDQIRAMAADAAVRPNEAERKVYIIPEAGLMNANAQNAMLKVLEEPPAHAAFILCAANPALLLPTVRSRCVVLRTDPGETDAPAGESAESAASFLELVREGTDGELFAFCEGVGGMSNQDALAFCAAVRQDCAAMLTSEAGIRRAMRLCELMSQAEAYLRVNTGTRHVMGLLAVKTIGMRKNID